MTKENSEIKALQEEIELMLLRKMVDAPYTSMALLMKLYSDFKNANRE
jgi:hypothetical protein